MDKTALRIQILQRLERLDAEARAAKSTAICKQAIQEIEWETVKRLSCYTYKFSLGEVNPSLLLEYLRQLPHSPQIDFIPADTSAEIPKGVYDAILVPLLAFDGDNNRLGRGAGWYDRFLLTQPQARTIGLAYAEQQVESVPIEPHDIPLDLVVHDGG